MTLQAGATPALHLARTANGRHRGERSLYNYAEVETFEQDVLGIHEKLEGLHDDYNISAIIMVHDVNGVRAPERIKAGTFAINGVSLAPVEKTIENGRKILAFRTEKTVAAIRKAMAAARAGNP